MFKLKNSAYTIFLAFLTVLLGVFLWAGLSGTRLLGDGKQAYNPQGPEGPRVHTTGAAGSYHRFYHK